VRRERDLVHQAKDPEGGGEGQQADSEKECPEDRQHQRESDQVAGDASRRGIEEEHRHHRDGSDRQGIAPQQQAEDEDQRQRKMICRSIWVWTARIPTTLGIVPRSDSKVHKE
jgi:hypothetical protein